MSFLTRPGGFAGSSAHINNWQNDLQARQPQIRVGQPNAAGGSSNASNSGGFPGLETIWDQIMGGRTGGTNPTQPSQPTTQTNTTAPGTITPSPIYSNQQKQEATNAAVAQQHMGANLSWLQNQAARPGMSIHSPATASRALPAYAGALAGGARAGVMTPLEMDTADASHLLAGQSALAGSNVDYNRIQSMLDAGDRGSQLSQSGALLQLLTSLMG